MWVLAAPIAWVYLQPAHNSNFGSQLKAKKVNK